MNFYKYSGRSYEDFALSGSDFENCKKMLLSMKKIRLVEEIIASKYLEDEMKTPIHLHIGQEAAVVGACLHMNKTDEIFCSHRTHGPYLAKGGNLERMLLELYGKVGGASGTRGGSMHLIDVEAGVREVSAIVGGIAPIAVGAAFANQEKNKLTTVFLGDAAMEEGVIWESINLAVLWNIPIIFFCENNFYSVCSPLKKRQPEIELYKKAEAFGVHSVQVDGNNVIDVSQAFLKAKERAQKNLGPTFIEAKVYRWLAHGGHADDRQLGYRPLEEIDHWKANCPIKLLTDFLVKNQIVLLDEISDWENKYKLDVLNLIETIRLKPEPDPKTLLEYVYA